MSLLNQYRQAAPENSTEEVICNVFTGPSEHCRKLEQIQDLFIAFQGQEEGLHIEAFVVPIPSDPQMAVALKRAIIQNVGVVFDQAHPKDSEFN